MVRGVASCGVLGAFSGEARALLASMVQCRVSMALATCYGERVPCSCGVGRGLSCRLRETGEKKSFMLRICFFCGFMVKTHNGNDSGGGVEA